VLLPGTGNRTSTFLRNPYFEPGDLSFDRNTKPGWFLPKFRIFTNIISMRRFVTLLLMLLFAANLSGAEVTHHLCGKVFQYISLNGHKKDSKCCCKGGKVDKGCCKTTYFKVNIDDEKILAEAYSLWTVFFIDALIPSVYTIASNTAAIEAPTPSDVYIPQKVRWWRDDIYIFYCVYRI
jgi:hypothetical protein